MENPATWGEAEQVVAAVLEADAEEVEMVGASLPRRITDALRERGLLVTDERGA